MKRLMSVLVLCVLAACTNKESVEAAPALPSASESIEGVVQADCRGNNFYSPLPEGVVINFPFHFRIDRIAPNKNGQLNRRVVLEIVDGDLAGSFDSAKQSLLEAGYQPSGKLKGSAAKKQSQKFKKKGAPTITLSSNVRVGKKPSNPSAVGVVYFDWLIDGEGVVVDPPVSE